MSVGGRNILLYWRGLSHILVRRSGVADIKGAEGSEFLL